MKIEKGELVMFLMGKDGALQNPSDNFDEFAKEAAVGRVIGTSDYYISVKILDDQAPDKPLQILQGDYSKLRFLNAEKQPRA